MAEPRESYPKQETDRNYNFEFIETVAQTGGNMGIVEITDRVIVVKDGYKKVGQIPVDGWVKKQDIGANNTTRFSFDNEVRILKHLSTNEVRAAPKVTVEGDEIRTELIRGIPGTMLEYGNNIFTAVEVAKLILRSQIELINDGVAYLDLKPGNYKVTTDEHGIPKLVRFFDFGNAALIKNGYITGGPEHLVGGFPPELFTQAVDKTKEQGGLKPGFLERAVKMIKAPQPVVANSAVLYATGKHFSVLLGSSRFAPGTSLQNSPEYRALKELATAMTHEESKKRPPLKTVWDTVKGISQPTRVGPCVSTASIEGLTRTGEIPLNWKEYATEEQIQEVLAKGPTRKS